MKTNISNRHFLTITHAVWSPQSLFSYGGGERPFVGVAEDKLENSPVMDIELTFFKSKPVLIGVNTKSFLDKSKEKGWVNKRRGRRIVYLPYSELRGLATSVKE